MAFSSGRYSLMRWLCRHYNNQKTFTCCGQTTALNRNRALPQSQTFLNSVNWSTSSCIFFRTFTSGHPSWSWNSKIWQRYSFSHTNKHFSVLSTVLGTVGFIVGCVAYLKTRPSVTDDSVLSTVSAFSDYGDHGDTDSATSSLSKRFNFVADVVEKAAPSVVYLEIIDRHPFSGRMLPVSNGSGFIVRADGLIVTNAHVVANKAAVKVRLFDGRELEGVVIAVDPVSDLAAIKVDAKGDLPVLKMGPSSKLRAGEWVIAMGSPLSLSNTVTCGIVSSVHRDSKELGIKNKDMEYIQTDALINFGNSGGPLVNLDGEVIGINAMKVTAGISFAIPSDYASNFLSKVDEIMKRGPGQPKKRQWFNLGSDTSRRRFIGITMLTLNNQLLLELKSRLPDFPDITCGVLVHKIIVGSPAFNGGLQAGDIITEINRQPIQASADVYRLVEASETLHIVAYRGQRKMTFTVTAEEVK